MSDGEKRSVGYFTNWGIYARNYLPQYLPVNDLTHVLYAFAKVDPASGNVFITDKWADEEIPYDADTCSVPGGETHLFGNFRALYLLKQLNRHLKVMLSIGGADPWMFHPVVVNDGMRAEFVRSAVALLEDYGLDGLDIDYEFPDDCDQAAGYVELLRELREALNQKQSENGDDCRFLLSVAAPCGPTFYCKLQVPEMNEHIDWWNLMAYDLAGSWSETTGHASSMHGSPFNAQTAIEFYKDAGVDPSKLVLGIPLHGHSFADTDGVGECFSGVGCGTWEEGTYDYSTLPIEGDCEEQDTEIMASWTYSPDRREFVTYDNADVARAKANFIRDTGLGGSMFWELAGDKMPTDTDEEQQRRAEREAKMLEAGVTGPGKDFVPGESLVRVVAQTMTDDGPGLDRSENWLNYPGSRFNNLAAGMGLVAAAVVAEEVLGEEEPAEEEGSEEEEEEEEEEEGVMDKIEDMFGGDDEEEEEEEEEEAEEEEEGVMDKIEGMFGGDDEEEEKEEEKEEEEEGVMDGVANKFKNMFGGDDEEE